MCNELELTCRLIVICDVSFLNKHGFNRCSSIINEIGEDGVFVLLGTIRLWRLKFVHASYSLETFLSGSPTLRCTRRKAKRK